MDTESLILLENGIGGGIKLAPIFVMMTVPQGIVKTEQGEE